MPRRIIVVPMWATPMGFEEWKVLAGPVAREVHSEETLWHFHGSCLDPAHIANIPVLDNSFTIRSVPRESYPVKRKRVALDRAKVDERIAMAIWKECNRLLARNLLRDARQHVSELADRMEKAAGIEVLR